MNLYEFSKDYLDRQTLANFLTFTMAELNWYNVPNLYAWPPFFTVARVHEHINDLMKMFSMILQKDNIYLMLLSLVLETILT